MDQFLALASIYVFGALAWFVHHRWLRNASPKILVYVTIGGALCMAALFLLGPSQITVVSGTLMALLFAVAISIRYGHYRRWLNGAT